MQENLYKPRWQYRFDNYKRAFCLLREAIAWYRERELSDLEKEGVIQRFEYTWELAWKTLKDYLENEGIVLDKITPKAVIVASVEANIIQQHETWMKALDDRNKMSHIYSTIVFNQVIKHIAESYLSLFDQLYEKLLGESIGALATRHSNGTSIPPSNNYLRIQKLNHTGSITNVLTEHP